MNFYQQLQLNQAGSKKLIRDTKERKTKLQRIFIYIFKVLLTVSFCFAFVTGFSLLFGTENSIVGVVTLLCVLVMRQADLGIDTKHGVGVLLGLFTIFAAGPHLSNLLPAGGALVVNLVCIFAIVLLSCHNLIMSNHSTFVLSYLLLQGYDVTGQDFMMRLAGLALGGMITALVFWHSHRTQEFSCRFSDLFREFDLTSVRSQWQIRFTLILCLILFVLQLAGLERVMWAGIAAMSVLTPTANDMTARVKWRGPGNVLGCLLFLALSFVLPQEVFLYIGIIGGICIGFSASYSWQTIFNTLGALLVASRLFGIPAAIFLRITHNTLGSILSLAFDRVFRFAANRLLPESQN